VNKDSPTRAILALVTGGLELALWGAVLVLCLLVALFIGGVGWIIGDVFFETSVGVVFGLAAVVGSLWLMYRLFRTAKKKALAKRVWDA
jgi:hypothetical protein